MNGQNKPETTKVWRVPMNMHFRDAVVRVTAESADEAERKANEGDWDDIEGQGECVDFYVTGEATEQT